MNNLVISLFLLTHVITDFWIQDNTLAENKKNKNIYLLIHALHFFIITFLITFYFFGFRLLPHILVLSLLHLAIDKLKTYIEIQAIETTSFIFGILEQIFQRTYIYKSILIFALDQVLHVLSIFLVSTYVANLTFTACHQKLSGWLIDNFSFLNTLNNNTWAYIIFVFTCYIFVINGGTVITKTILVLPDELRVRKKIIVPCLKLAHEEQAAVSDIDDNSIDIEYKRKDGEVIGILERIIVLTLIIFQRFEAIAFVVAAKSIARFKEFNKEKEENVNEKQKDFADYYLEGTLASIGVAIITGIVLNIVKQILHVKIN